jgi:hypothetical protein
MITNFPAGLSPHSLISRILRGHLLHRFRTELSPVEANQALHEAEQIAAETGFPHLVLPILADERLRHAVEAHNRLSA